MCQCSKSSFVQILIVVNKWSVGVSGSAEAEIRHLTTIIHLPIIRNVNIGMTTEAKESVTGHKAQNIMHKGFTINHITHCVLEISIIRYVWKHNS